MPSPSRRPGRISFPPVRTCPFGSGRSGRGKCGGNFRSTGTRGPASTIPGGRRGSWPRSFRSIRAEPSQVAFGTTGSSSGIYLLIRFADKSSSSRETLVRRWQLRPDGLIFASASATRQNPDGDDTSIRLWSFDTGLELLRLEPGGRGVESLAFSPDGRTLISGMDDTTVLIWDVSSAYDALTRQRHEVAIEERPRVH